jgi:hypothetical protein
MGSPHLTVEASSPHEQIVEIVLVHVLHPGIGKCDVVFQSLWESWGVVVIQP